MAAVLDALAPYLKKLVAEMADEEVRMLLGVSSEIKKLEENVGNLEAFLADAERRRINDKTVQRWVRKLKDAMYDATDILDLCHLEADKRRHSIGGKWEPGCFQSILFCLRDPVFAHKLGSRIKELNQRLEGIHREADKFKFSIGLGSNLEPMRLTSADQFCGSKTRAQIDESAIVGEQIERDTKELVQALTTTDDKHSIKVVSIIGTGGMGKTTLAQKIFNETSIQEHFKVKIWLSINKHFDDVELLRTAIKFAGGDHGGEKDQSTLTGILINTLTSNGRFLLVMDDVWSERAWNDVLSVPVKNASRKQPGSRVLVTTRSAHLPQQMQAPLHQHRVRPLNEDDAWSLLKKQLQPDQVVGIDQLKNIGMEILKKCDGLPLATKVVGGLLSTRYPSEHEWKAVLNKPAWSHAGLPPELDNRIYLSYEDLTPQLKQCFAHCSLFPKGVEIFQEVVSHMWVSEGFVQSRDASSSAGSHHEYGLEDIAAEHYEQLIRRNLIEPTKAYSLTGYRCSMHDVVRSFAEYVAREELLVVVDEELSATSGGEGGGGLLLRRLSLRHAVSVVEWAILQRQQSLRTLIIDYRVNFKPGDSLGSFSSLRVLYIRSADSDKLIITSLSKLKHLRYLQLENTDISRLPDDIHKMKFLQYIYLINCEKLGHIPCSAVKLVQLKSISFIGSSVRAVPKGFGGLTNLRSLFWFPVHMDTDVDSSCCCSLQELAPLAQLRRLSINGLEKVPAGWMAEKAMISSKGHLCFLRLQYNGCPMGPEGEAEQNVMEEVLEKLRPPTCIDNLSVRGGYAGRRLPNWMRAPAFASFKSLRFFMLENLPGCTQLPDGICCLPCLELLTIKDAPLIKRVGPEFQASSSLLESVDSAVALAPFPKLRELQLNGLSGWEEWEWDCSEEKGCVNATIAMPCLETLMIKNCKLSRLPPGLVNSRRHAFRQLSLHELTNLTSVENFPSVVDLDVFDCPQLNRISGLSRLQRIKIVRCPNVVVLEGVTLLDSLVLQDPTMKTLPQYLGNVNPRYLRLKCRKELYDSIISGGSSESDKISHMRTRAANYYREDEV